MKLLFAIFSTLFFSNSAHSFYTYKDPDTLILKCTEQNQEECTFVVQFSSDLISEPLKIEDISIFEVEEDVEINFNTKAYLPDDFNPLKGLGDLDWSIIDLNRIEEDVFIDFDTKKYLPEDFNSLKGLGDLDWSKIELIEMEEEVEINFNTKLHLPENFNPNKGF